MQNISLAFGGPILIDGINMQVHEGEKICLLGRNGSGKSTLMKIIDGAIKPDSGTIHRIENLKTARLSQDVPDNLSGKVYTIIAEGIATLDHIEEHHDRFEEQKLRQQIDITLSLISVDPELDFENLSAGMKTESSPWPCSGQ